MAQPLPEVAPPLSSTICRNMINTQTLRTGISPWVRESAHVNLALALHVEGAGTHAEELPQALHADTLVEQVPLCPDMLGFGA